MNWHWLVIAPLLGLAAGCGGACAKSAREPGTYVFWDGGRRRIDGTLEPSLRPRDLG
jgi:hypothetical protein